MSPALQALLAAPIEDRIEAFLKLYESLGAEDKPYALSDAQKAELDAVYAAVRSGTMTTFSWEEVSMHLQQRLQQLG